MRQWRGVIASSMFIIAVFFLQGCGVKWWGSESGQEGPMELELIKEPALKEILPDESTDRFTNKPDMQSISCLETPPARPWELNDVLFDSDQDTVGRRNACLGANAKELQHDG